MKTIHKYELEITDEQSVAMPSMRQILSVGTQHGRVYVWALVDTDYAEAPVRFRIIGTGNPAGEEPNKDSFLGTVITDEGKLVWHIFTEWL